MKRKIRDLSFTAVKNLLGYIRKWLVNGKTKKESLKNKLSF